MAYVIACRSLGAPGEVAKPLKLRGENETPLFDD